MDFELALGEPLDRMLLSDSIIRRNYVQAIEDLIADWDHGEVASHLREVEQEEVQKLYSQFPLLESRMLDSVPSRAAALLRLIQDTTQLPPVTESSPLPENYPSPRANLQRISHPSRILSFDVA